MFLYHFEQYAGTDKVFDCDTDGLSVGDLIQPGWGGYGLVLWENVAWKEQYKKQWQISWAVCLDEQVVVSWLLSEQSVSILHWFVNEWYTTYKNSFWLWLHDIDDIVKRCPAIRAKKKKKIEHPLLTFSSQSSSLQELAWGNEVVHWQQLIVFPDVWSLTQSVSDQLQERNNVCVLHGKSTKKQKTQAFWWIKTWKITLLLCTYSQIFQDRHDLKHITLVDAHLWYYKHYQDPRYAVASVLERMAQEYDAKLLQTWNTLSISNHKEE